VFGGVGVEHWRPCQWPQLYRGVEAVAPGLNVDPTIWLAREQRFKRLRSGAQRVADLIVPQGHGANRRGLLDFAGERIEPDAQQWADPVGD
jgi:hypothetical protein